MPPKKKPVEEEKPIIIGRLSTNLKCGIVGLPNVGKSTFFNVLTKTQIAAAENFPFCTIDPNENKYQIQYFFIDKVLWGLMGFRWGSVGPLGLTKTQIPAAENFPF